MLISFNAFSARPSLRNRTVKEILAVTFARLVSFDVVEPVVGLVVSSDPGSNCLGESWVHRSK